MKMNCSVCIQNQLSDSMDAMADQMETMAANASPEKQASVAAGNKIVSVVFCCLKPLKFNN